ncbi:MAG: hypothetical protein ACAI38_22150 [Myxococcota bacterium]|nr:hypothetical protein [Myxococcota bacterium]
MTRITRKPAPTPEKLTEAERIAQKALPGWKVVRPKPHSGPAAKPDAVAPPLWYEQYKVARKPIPKDVHGVFQVGQRFVAVQEGKLLENARVDFGNGPVIVEDGFVVIDGITRKGEVVSGGKVIGHRG